jgi:agmatinase
MARKFFTDLFPISESDALIMGVTLGRDTQHFLDGLREASWFVESFDVDRKKNLLAKVKTADIGDISPSDCKEITMKVKEIVGIGKVPLILGDEHLITLYSSLGAGKHKLVVFDAHSDLAGKYEDEKFKDFSGDKFDPKFNGATWLRRYCDAFSPKDVCIIGLRSCDEDIMEFIDRNEILYFTPKQIREDLDSVRKKLEKFIKDSDIYISLDIDVFDPSIAPMVSGYPEPDGLSYSEFRSLAGFLKGNIKAMDVVGIHDIGESEAFKFLVVKAIFELLGLLSN